MTDLYAEMKKKGTPAAKKNKPVAVDLYAEMAAKNKPAAPARPLPAVGMGALRMAEGKTAAPAKPKATALRPSAVSIPAVEAFRRPLIPALTITSKTVTPAAGKGKPQTTTTVKPGKPSLLKRVWENTQPNLINAVVGPLIGSAINLAIKTKEEEKEAPPAYPALERTPAALVQTLAAARAERREQEEAEPTPLNQLLPIVGPAIESFVKNPYTSLKRENELGGIDLNKPGARLVATGLSQGREAIRQRAVESGALPGIHVKKNKNGTVTYTREKVVGPVQEYGKEVEYNLAGWGAGMANALTLGTFNAPTSDIDPASPQGKALSRELGNLAVLVGTGNLAKGLASRIPDAATRATVEHIATANLFNAEFVIAKGLQENKTLPEIVEALTSTAGLATAVGLGGGAVSKAMAPLSPQMRAAMAPPMGAATIGAYSALPPLGYGEGGEAAFEAGASGIPMGLAFGAMGIPGALKTSAAAARPSAAAIPPGLGKAPVEAIAPRVEAPAPLMIPPRVIPEVAPARPARPALVAKPVPTVKAGDRVVLPKGVEGEVTKVTPLKTFVKGDDGRNYQPPTRNVKVIETPKGVPVDTQNVKGVSGEVAQRQEPVKAEPVKKGGSQATKSGRVLQEEGEVAEIPVYSNIAKLDNKNLRYEAAGRYNDLLDAKDRGVTQAQIGKTVMPIDKAISQTEKLIGSVKAAAIRRERGPALPDIKDPFAEEVTPARLFKEGDRVSWVTATGKKETGRVTENQDPDIDEVTVTKDISTGGINSYSKSPDELTREPAPTPRTAPQPAKEAKKGVEADETWADKWLAEEPEPTPTPKAPAKPAVKAAGGSAGTSALRATASVALPQAATQAKPAVPVRVSDIVKDLADAFAPIRSGHVRWGTRAGIFKVIPRVIRTRKVNDLPVIAHEVGHALQGLMFPGPLTPRGDLSSKNMPRAYWKELSPMAYPGATKKITEGYAEFVRLYLVDPVSAEAKAPNFYRHFTTTLDGLPEVKTVVDKAQSDITRYINQPAAAKVRSTLRSRYEKPRKGGVIDQTRKVAEDAYTHLYDDLHPVYKAEMALTGGVQLPADKSAYMKHRLARGSGAVAHDWVFLGRTDRMGDPAGPSLKEVLHSVNKELEAFEEYAVSLHGLDVMQKLGDQAMPLPRSVYQEVVDAAPAHYRGVMRDLVKYQNALLDVYVQAGLLSPEGKTAMRAKWPNHIPLYRAMEDRPTGGLGLAGQPIKRLKGSGRDILNPIESIVKDTFVTHHLAMNNEANLSLVKLATTTEGGGRFVEKFDAMPMEMKKVSLERILSRAEQEMAEDAGLDVEALRKAFFTDYQTPRGEYVMRIFRNGEPEFYTVEPALYDTLAALDMSSRNIVVRALSVPTKLLRAGAILTPEFSVFRNPARDVLEVTMNSQQWMTPIDFVLGYYHATTKSPIYRQARALGGGQSALVSPDIDTMKMSLRAIKESGTLDTMGNTLKHPIDALRAVSEFFEEGTRTAEYVSRVRAGKAETRSERMEAAFAKRESSIDFGRRGRTGKLINQMKAFFNAAMQGANRFARVHKAHPGRSMLRGALYITLPTIMLYLKNKDDEDYQRLPEWRKDMFWNFPFQWGGKRYFFPVPIPHLWGLAYKVIPERLMRQIGEQDPHAWDEFARTVGNTALPFDDFLSAMPTALEPLLRTVANQSFTGAPIVPRREQDLPKPLQIGPYTSGLARALGDRFNLSPRQLDSIVYGYTGGLGRHGVNIVSAGLQAAKITNVPPKPAAGVSEWPVLRAAVLDPRQVESVYISRFYDELTALEQQSKRADAKKEEFSEEDKARLSTLRSTARKLSEMRKATRAVFDARTVTGLRAAISDELVTAIGGGSLPLLKRRALNLLALTQEELAQNPTGGSTGRRSRLERKKPRERPTAPF